MPAIQIPNPAQAFDAAAATHGGDVEYFVSAETANTILAGQAVSINTSGEILRATTSVALALIIGVALRDIPPGAAGPVVTRGLVRGALAQGAITAGAAVIRSGTTAGSLAAAGGSETVQQTIGFAVAAASGDLVDVYINKA